jgi:signal transduction histidine kinase
MHEHRPDLEHLTTLLRQCLVRIDEQAHLVQRLNGKVTDSMASFLFEDEDAALQGLLESLLASSAPDDHADLNRVVHRTVQSFLGATHIPVVVRERLGSDLPPIGCGPVPLTCAVRRALDLALGHTEGSRDITVTTRAEADSVVFEVERHSAECEHYLKERALTLCEFVARMDGECRIDYDERGALLIAIDLPRTLPVDEY